MRRNTDTTIVIGVKLTYKAVNPVVRVGREPTTFLRIKLIDGFHQSDDTLLEHVLIRELFVLIVHFLGEFTHQPKIMSNHLLHGLLTTILCGFAQFNLLNMGESLSG